MVVCFNELDAQGCHCVYVPGMGLIIWRAKSDNRL
jgi:hypothetical protein